MSIFDLSEQEIIRRNSLNELRKMGIEPYPAAEYKVNAYTEEMKASFNDDAEPRQVSIAGRRSADDSEVRGRRKRRR